MSEELRLDYEDFLRQRGLAQWAEDDPRRGALVVRRCATADEVAEWVREQHDAARRNGRHGQNGHDGLESMESISFIRSTYPALAANAALVLIGVASALLARQIAAQAEAFEAEGGFTERLHRVRTTRRSEQEQRT